MVDEALIQKDLDIEAQRDELLRLLRISASGDVHLNGSALAASYLRDQVDSDGDQYVLPAAGIDERVPVSDPLRIRQFWIEAFRDDNRTFVEFEWHRTVVCWRITWEMARISRVIHEDELLTEGLFRIEQEMDPWVVYCGKRSGVRTAGDRHLNTFLFESNLGLAPPEVPPLWRDEHGFIRDGYDPEDDQVLNSFIAAAKLVYRRIRGAVGSLKYPDLGDFGSRGIFNPKLIRLLWPSRNQILALEERIVEEGLEDLIKSGGSLSLRKSLRETYGFRYNESLAVEAACSRYALTSFGQGSMEEERTKVALRLEEFIMRARDGMDLRAELMAIKALANIRGVTRAEPEDVLKAFASAVKGVAAASKPTPHLIEAQKVE